MTTFLVLSYIRLNIERKTDWMARVRGIDDAGAYLKKFDVPTLILHGDDDQIVPIAAAAMQSSKIVKGATLKVYPGYPHGMCSTHKDVINAELLAFFKQAGRIAA